MATKGKTLLITGGTGSFGNAALRYFKDTFKEIRIFSRDEKKQDDMRNELNLKNLKFYIGDIRDRSSIDSAIKGVDFVFHAAALKQVPSCEFYPMEAVKTNILGTQNLISSITENNVLSSVFLSTDKAAYPVNAMGISKSMMEKLVVAESRMLEDHQVMSTTRYGNVMASRGSVIPLFVKQLKDGKAITVTDPEMTRFMMNLDESVELVKFAFSNAKPGDLFIKKSPSASLKTLIDALSEIFSIKARIEVMGTRHGEKLYETLMTREEMSRSEDMGEFYRIPADNRDLNYDKFFIEGKKSTSKFEDYHSHNADLLDQDSMVEKLLELKFIKQELQK